MQPKESVYESVENAVAQLEGTDRDEDQDDEVEDDQIEAGGTTDHERDRDEGGRFKSKSADDEQPEADQPETTESKHDPEAEELKGYRPGSFRDKELWDRLSAGEADKNDQKALAKYYLDRENQFHQGIEGYKDQAAKNNYLSQALEPYIPRILQERNDPAQFIRNIADSHFNIVNATPENRLHIFNHLAAQYGITMASNGQGGYQAQPMDYQSQVMSQQMQHYEREIGALKQWRETETSAMLQGEISQLVNDRNNFPYFDELREPMAQLLESGHARTFEEAYQVALRFNGDLWDKYQARQLSHKSRNTTNPVAKAKNLAVSPRTSAPRQSSSANSNKSVRELLEEQFYG